MGKKIKRKRRLLMFGIYVAGERFLKLSDPREGGCYGGKR